MRSKKEKLCCLGGGQKGFSYDWMIGREVHLQIIPTASISQIKLYYVTL